MIDVKKLRERAEIDHRKDRPMGADPADVIELLDRLEAAERNADRDKYAFNLMCEAVQAIEKAVGIDTGGWNGPAPAVDSVRAVVRDRDALAAQMKRVKDARHKERTGPDFDESDFLYEILCAVDEAHDTSLARRDAEKRIEGALAIRHLTRGDDWEDDELRQVIDDYVSELRRQFSEQSP